MKIIYNRITTETIEEFAEKYNLTMVVTEREPRDSGTHAFFGRYFAKFDCVEVKKGVFKEGVFLRSVFGDGETEEKAIQNYAKQISGKLLVLNAYGPESIEIRCPYFRGANA